ncbi:hypothetical protein OHR68_06355 [Spirillospora sp. NBC_00431]
MNDVQQKADISPEDLVEFLSEVWNIGTFANITRTQQFLEAGERLLYQGLARDAGEEPVQRSSRIRTPFEYEDTKRRPTCPVVPRGSKRLWHVTSPANNSSPWSSPNSDGTRCAAEPRHAPPLIRSDKDSEIPDAPSPAPSLAFSIFIANANPAPAGHSHLVIESGSTPMRSPKRAAQRRVLSVD